MQRKYLEHDRFTIFIVAGCGNVTDLFKQDFHVRPSRVRQGYGSGTEVRYTLK